ncbi:hypothetical protein CsSME_00024338 [Camellia sinensis var. sinensis]
MLEELNVKSIVPCNDPLKHASLRAAPEFSVLGKRLGKSMPVVAKEVKAMPQEDILAFEKSGEITVAAHSLKLTDIKVHRFSCVYAALYLFLIRNYQIISCLLHI